MARLTIAQLREKDTEKLAEIMGDYEKARRFYNSFYRLAGLESRLLCAENDARNYESAWRRAYLEKESDRAYKWLIRLNKELKPYGYKIHCSGGYLSIYKNDDTTNALGECLTRGWWY